MFRYKSSMKSVTIAVMVILLCMICLVGATLALFGDTADGAIGIITTAGDIKVDIVDATEEHNSLVGSYLRFRTSIEDQGDQEDQKVIFEPGATYYTEGFQIENEGNVKINFRLSVSDTIKTDEDVRVSIEEFNESFEIWLTTDPKNMDNAQRMTEFVDSLGAESISTDTYYLIIRMKEDASNKFQGKTYKGIGVTVYAVQGNVDITNVEE